MAVTYQPIATYTVSGTSTTSYTFTSIPQTFTDLVIVASGTGTNDIDLSCRFNSDSGSNYSRTILWGSGSSYGSARSTNISFFRLNYQGYWTSSTVAVSIGHVMNYSNTNVYKSVITRSNNASIGVDSQVCLWRSTSAVTSLEIYTSAYAFGSGTTFTLYGIKAA